MTPVTSQEHIVRSAIDEALAASRAAGASLSPAMVFQVHHVCRLAAAAPAVQITWIVPGSLAAGVLQRSSTVAVALLKSATAATPAIVRQDDLNSVLHELGHFRDSHLKTSTKLGREIAAWRFAAEKSLVWDRTCHESMARALAVYCVDPSLEDIPDLQAMEQLCSAEAFRRLEKSITRHQLAAFEAREFELQHGACTCARGARCLTPGRAACVATPGGFYCRRCAVDVELDSRIAQLRKEHE